MNKYNTRESFLLVESLLKLKKSDVTILTFIKGSGKAYQGNNLFYERLYKNGRVVSINHIEQEYNNLIKNIKDNTEPFKNNLV